MSNRTDANRLPPGGRRGNRYTEMPESPPELLRLHKGLLAVAAFFFIYLIVEATVLLPYMIVKFGWW